MTATEEAVATPPRGWRWADRRLLDVTGSKPYMPLLLLFMLWLFDQFDTTAFTVLAPDIKRAFGFSDRAFLTIAVANTLLLLIAAVPLGYFADRTPRVVLIAIGGMVAGVFSFLTGVATSAVMFVLMRFGNGVGQLVNDPVHTSVLADIYSHDARPRVFAFHRNATHVGGILGALVAGGLAYLFGWRACFVILTIPIFAFALLTLRSVPEPVRGATDNATAQGVVVPMVRSFRAAARILVAVPTVRRIFLTWAVLGAAYIPLGVYVPLFQDRIFHLDAAARGMVSAANAAATLLGVLKSGKWTQTLVRCSQGAPLGLAGAGLIGTGLLTLLYAVTPWLVLSLFIGVAAFFSFGVVTVAAVTVQAAVSPPNVRTLSFSFSSFFAIAGAAVFLVTPLAQVSDHMGIRWAVGFTAPFWVVAGLVLYFARRGVEADTIAPNAARRAETPSPAAKSLAGRLRMAGRVLRQHIDRVRRRPGGPRE